MMPTRIIQKVLRVQSIPINRHTKQTLKAINRPLLHSQILRVFKWKVEESTLEQPEVLVHANLQTVKT